MSTQAASTSVRLGAVPLYGINPETLQFEATDPEKLRVVLQSGTARALPVITIVVYGRARTGKSTMLNHVIKLILVRAFGSMDAVRLQQLHPDVPAVHIGECPATGEQVPLAFGVGHGARPCSKGGNGCFIHLPQGALGRSEECVVAVIDSEGTGDEDEAHDAKVILPGLALCSRGVFMANMKNPPMKSQVLDTIKQILDAALIVGKGRRMDQQAAGGAGSTGQGGAAAGDRAVASNDRSTFVLVARDVSLEPTQTIEEAEEALMRREHEDPFGGTEADAAKQRNQARDLIQATFVQCRQARIPPPSVSGLRPGQEYPKDFSAALGAIGAMVDRSVIPCLQDEKPRYLLGNPDMPCDTQHFGSVRSAVVQQANDATDALRPMGILESMKAQAKAAAAKQLCEAIERALVALNGPVRMDCTASPGTTTHAMAVLQDRACQAALETMRASYRLATEEDARALVTTDGGDVAESIRNLNAAMISKARDRQAMVLQSVCTILRGEADNARHQQLMQLELKLQETISSTDGEDASDPDAVIASRKTRVLNLEALQEDLSGVTIAREVARGVHAVGEQLLADAEGQLRGDAGDEGHAAVSLLAKVRDQACQQLCSVALDGAAVREADAGVGAGAAAGGAAAGGAAEAGVGESASAVPRLQPIVQLLLAMDRLSIDEDGRVRPESADVSGILAMVVDENEGIDAVCEHAESDMERFMRQLDIQIAAAKHSVEDAERFKDNKEKLEQNIRQQQEDAAQFQQAHERSMQESKEAYDKMQAEMAKQDREFQQYRLRMQREIAALREAANRKKKKPWWRFW